MLNGLEMSHKKKRAPKTNLKCQSNWKQKLAAKNKAKHLQKHFTSKSWTWLLSGLFQASCGNRRPQNFVYSHNKNKSLLGMLILPVARLIALVG